MNRVHEDLSRKFKCVFPATENVEAIMFATSLTEDSTSDLVVA